MGTMSNEEFYRRQIANLLRSNGGYQSRATTILLEFLESEGYTDIVQTYKDKTGVK
jgi:hypothetical protein